MAPFKIRSRRQLEDTVELAIQAGMMVTLSSPDIPPGHCAIYFKNKLVEHGAIFLMIDYMERPGYVIVIHPDDMAQLAEHKRKKLH